MTCTMQVSRIDTARLVVETAINNIKSGAQQRINAIWLETTGCSGNIISLLNAREPDLIFLLRQMINLKYSNSLMANEGEAAFDKFKAALNTEFVLLVDGAIALNNEGFNTIIASDDGKRITALEALKMASANAKYIIAVGTCASYGGISAASPNPSKCVSVDKVINRQVIKLPGCPANPDWVTGTIAHILTNGLPNLDSEGRPTLFYGITIHDLCQRRSLFEKGIFAQKLGEYGCMLKIGCKGPVTKTDCPTRQWNGHINWPVADSTPCIGCANEKFPDGMEPFVKY